MRESRERIRIRVHSLPTTIRADHGFVKFNLWIELSAYYVGLDWASIKTAIPLCPPRVSPPGMFPNGSVGVCSTIGTGTTHGARSDYKPDSVTEAQLAVRVEYYRPQCEKYTRTAPAQTGLAIADISRRLVFLRAGRVMELRGSR